MLIVSENLSDLRAEVLSWKQNNEVVGFVPTMGNLHKGHLSLISKIRRCGATKTIVSIYTTYQNVPLSLLYVRPVLQMNQ